MSAQIVKQEQNKGFLNFIKPALTMPNTLVLLVILVPIAGALTYVIPAGEFNRVKDQAGHMVIIPGTFHPINPNPLSIFQVPLKLFKGIMKAADVVFFPESVRNL